VFNNNETVMKLLNSDSACLP